MRNLVIAMLILVISSYVLADTKTAVAKVKPSLVWIHSFSYPIIDEEGGGVYGNYSTGTGFVIGADGIIMTNNHVVEKTTGVIATIEGSGSFHYARIIYTDPDKDLAIIKIDTTGLEAVTWATSSPSMGETVYILGYPGGTPTPETPKLTGGMVSNSPIDEEYIQTDAAVNHGNSGGPMFDNNGDVIGVVFAKSAAEETEGLGFGISLTDIRSTISHLNSNGLVSAAECYGVANFSSEDEIGICPTKSFTAYKKFCEAEIEIITCPTLIPDLDIITSAKSKLLSAIDIDGDYVDPHYFLAYLYLWEAMHYSEEDELKTLAAYKHMKKEYEKAIELKPSLGHETNLLTQAMLILDLSEDMLEEQQNLNSPSEDNNSYKEDSYSYQTNCGYSEFKCENGRCIPKYKKCNDVNDCGDWSDEIGCSAPDHPSSSSYNPSSSSYTYRSRQIEGNFLRFGYKWIDQLEDPLYTFEWAHLIEYSDYMGRMTLSYSNVTYADSIWGYNQDYKYYRITYDAFYLIPLASWINPSPGLGAVVHWFNEEWGFTLKPTAGLNLRFKFFSIGGFVGYNLMNQGDIDWEGVEYEALIGFAFD